MSEFVMPEYFNITKWFVCFSQWSSELYQTDDLYSVLLSLYVRLCEIGCAKNDKAPGGFVDSSALANFGHQWLSHTLQNDTVPCMATKRDDRTAPTAVSVNQFLCFSYDERISFVIFLFSLILRWIDGFSTFYVNSDGRIIRHIADKVMPDEDKEPNPIEKVVDKLGQNVPKLALVVKLSTDIAPSVVWIASGF